MINAIEQWLLRHILAKQVLQGFDHDANIRALYLMIRDACDAEFTEDNQFTRDAHLRELFESTQCQPTDYRCRGEVAPNFNDADAM